MDAAERNGYPSSEMLNSRRCIYAAVAALVLAGGRSAAEEASGPGEAMKARLALPATLDGAFDRPAKLARLCLDAQLACGFELRADVWGRPVAKRRILSATVGQALEIFIGADYRLSWRDGVLLMEPVAPGPAALDAEISADVSGKSPVDPAESLRVAAKMTGLKLKAEGRPPRAADPGTGVTMPMTAPARRVFGLWARPAQAHPNTWIAVYSRDGRSGKLYWFWGLER